jgi:DNA mismatch repair ATPase MutL
MNQSTQRLNLQGRTQPAPAAVRLLDDDLQKQIRASAIVPTFHLAVEEVIYNAIDAKSRAIDLFVDLDRASPRYGSAKVVDDGQGIHEHDLFSRVGEWHQSSKGVDRVSLQPQACARALSYTYGLKGEALAAVRSLSSTLRVTTRQNGSAHAHSKVFDSEKGAVSCHSWRCGCGEQPDTRTTVGAISVSGTLMDQELKFGTSVGALVSFLMLVLSFHSFHSFH